MACTTVAQPQFLAVDTMCTPIFKVLVRGALLGVLAATLFALLNIFLFVLPVLGGPIRFTLTSPLKGIPNIAGILC